MPVAIMVIRVRRRESVERREEGLASMAVGRCFARGQRTEDELFGRSEHVDGKCHLILVDLEAHPAHEAAQNPEEEGHGCREEIVVVCDSVAEEISQGVLNLAVLFLGFNCSEGLDRG